jgi:hypothetical protein
MLGVIYIQEGKTALALVVWREIVREVPEYQPARANLEIVRPSEVAAEREAAKSLYRPACCLQSNQRQAAGLLALPAAADNTRPPHRTRDSESQH